MIVTDKFKNFSLWTQTEHEAEIEKELASLSDFEREAVFLALAEREYEQEVFGLQLVRPIMPIHEWVDDPYFMGDLTRSLYKPWKHDLIELFSSDIYSTAVIIGGIGSGKSTFSHLAILRMLYEASCLRDPARAYGLAAGSSIAFCNLAKSKETARRVVFEAIVAKVAEIDYFKYDFPPMKENKDEIIFPKGLQILAGSSTDSSIIGANIFGGIIDEGNFWSQANKKATNSPKIEDAGASKRWGAATKAGRLFDAVQRRMKSRYMRHGRLPGVLIVVSSKTTHDSFTETLVKNAMAGEDNTVFVRDRNLIEVKREVFDKKTFRIVVGNESFQSKILAEDEDDASYKGATIIEIPEDLRPDFEGNIDEALRDIAGVSTVSISQFIRKAGAVDGMIDPLRAHPFVCVLMGDPMQWDSRLPYRINWDMIANRLPSGEWEPKVNPHLKRHVHLDPGLTGDAFGICIAHVAGSTPVKRFEGSQHEMIEEMPYFYIDFVLRVVGVPGEEVLFRNIRQLCYEFSGHGFHLSEFTTDTYQCFTGDTKVKMLDGRNLSMKDLADNYGHEKEFWVYSYDGRRIVPGRGRNARKTGTKKTLVIELDNGEKVRCTYDHPWMMRDGKYRAAQDLRAGDSLMPLYTRLSTRARSALVGYEEVYQPFFGVWDLTHRMVMRDLYGDIRGKTVHHAGKCLCGKCKVPVFCKLNNDPSSLQVMTKEEHQRMHHELAVYNMSKHLERYRSLPEDHPDKIYYKNRFRQTLLANRSVPATKAKLAKIGADRLALINEKRWSDLGERKKQADRIREWNASHQDENHNRWNKDLDFEKIVESIKNIGITKTASIFGLDRNSLRGMLRRRGVDTKKFGSPGNRGNKNQLNHKIVNISEGEIEDVYDIEVDRYHNFALSAGVFVHNSREMIQSLREQGYKAGVYSVDTGIYTKPENDERPSGDSQLDGRGNDKRKQAYRYFRRCLYEGRVNCYDYPILIKELKGLQEGPVMIDHPENGSKDLADAVAGCVMTLFRADYSMEPIAPQKGISLPSTPLEDVEADMNAGDVTIYRDGGMAPKYAQNKYVKKMVKGPKTIKPTYKKVGMDGQTVDLTKIDTEDYLSRG